MNSDKKENFSLRLYCNGEYGIPDYTFTALKNYLELRVPVGDFLYAVLTNNLFSAIRRADGNNSKKLVEIVEFLYNEFPMCCYGNEEKVREWLNEKD